MSFGSGTGSGLPGSSVSHLVEDSLACLTIPRRIRHVTCVQVCNFTPFPVRDHVTTALSQPVEPSQLNSLSHISDDLDVASRIRTRKMSATSTTAKSSGRLEEEDTPSLSEPRGRKLSQSRRSVHGILGVDNSPPGIARIPYGSSQTLRRRDRTNSVASSGSNQTKPSSLYAQGGSAVPISGSSFSMILPDVSQQGLEKVVHSRLIETFLTIQVSQGDLTSQTRTPAAKTFTTPGRRTQMASISSLPVNISRGKGGNGTVRSLPSKFKASHSRSPSFPVHQPNGTEAKSSSSRLEEGSALLVPDFFSKIHRPSVNPTFPIDARPGHDFSSVSPTSGDQLTVQLWGQTKGASAKAAGKRKRTSVCELVEDDPEWNVMEEWVFSLNDLLPFPENVSSHPPDLPPNTLLVTLSPPGKTFYLPVIRPSLLRPPSPTVGYSSDPESTSKKPKRDDRTSDFVVDSLLVSDGPAARVRFHNTSDGAATPSKGPARTAAYQQLFEFVNLQALLLEHESTLSDLIQRIDKHLESDPVSPLRRRISEQQYRLSVFHNDYKMAIEETAARKKALELRRLRLKERKQSLVSARILEQTNISDSNDLELDVIDERDQLEELHRKFAPVRVGLLSTLASIYPVELESPPDLLYTILDVPLPIPLTATDPAPPLSLPNHQNVNEDAVATALGYVAQILQLLAVYLGKSLIYPVTCVGSRSFIKDGISAMVGPRMFPLFSKGVDTYRFEYGVFLLNKNIEMLMLDRDLRALDMRHTLPNLKNLVLTVTHGEVAPIKSASGFFSTLSDIFDNNGIGSRKVPQDSPALSMSGLNSPTQEEPSADIGSVTPKATAKKLDLKIPPNDSGTPPGSGATTPTASTMDEKKPRPFLGLSFPDFLRGRYASTSRASVRSVPGGLDGGRSQVDVSGSNESVDADAPEAYGDQAGDVKPAPETTDVPNRRSNNEGGDEQAIEQKVEASSGSEATSLHVH